MMRLTLDEVIEKLQKLKIDKAMSGDEQVFVETLGEFNEVICSYVDDIYV